MKNQHVLLFLLWGLVIVGILLGWQLKIQWEKHSTPPAPPAVQTSVPRAVNGPLAPQTKQEPVPLKEITHERPVYVHRPYNLGEFSKEEVFKHRVEAVKDSIFDERGYVPSEEVFGGIVSYKPWIATNVCRTAADTLEVNGPSEEDRFIGNPTLLVAVEYPFSFNRFDPRLCTEDSVNLLPQQIAFNPSENEITVTYKKFPFSTIRTNKHAFYAFNGVNARDLGYPFAYVDLNKTTLDMQFVSEDNISTRVVEFQNFIHVGGSCGVSGGCNNGSPRQPFLEFRTDPFENEEPSKEIFVKLWKEKPASAQDPADLVERIVVAEP